MKPGLWAFKRLEPDDGKLSRPVLRGRRRWQHLLCYPTIILFYIRLFYLKVLRVLGLISLLTTYTFAPEVIAKPETAVNLAKPDAKQSESGKSESKQSGSGKPDSSKPDIQKVYDAAKNWSKAKLDQMPDTATSHQTSNIGVCRGASNDEPLMIKPPCPKKQKQQLHEVVDAVTDDHRNGAKNTAQVIETRRNSHHATLSASEELKILVFVSFSMPKASLRALAKEASKHNVVLVMRGLKGDSFKTTQQAFLELASEDDKEKLDLIAKTEDMQGFEVNPELFKTYQIKKVPTFILVKHTKEISRLSGNVSLEYATKKLKESL